jgi:hypothetical protein
LFLLCVEDWNHSPDSWHEDIAISIISTPGFDPLSHSGEPYSRTVLEAVLDKRSFLLPKCRDRLEAALLLVTPPWCLTAKPVNNEWTHHQCSMLGRILQNYLRYGPFSLDALVHVYGVDSNGIDLNRICTECSHNAVLGPCKGKGRCDIITGPEDAETRKEDAWRYQYVAETIDQLRAKSKHYHTELPNQLRLLMQDWCGGAVSPVCSLTVGYLNYSNLPARPLTPRASSDS